MRLSLFGSHLHLLLSDLWKGLKCVQESWPSKAIWELKATLQLCKLFKKKHFFAFAFASLLFAFYFHLSPKTAHTKKKFIHIPPWHLGISWTIKEELDTTPDWVSFFLFCTSLLLPVHNVSRETLLRQLCLHPRNMSSLCIGVFTSPPLKTRTGKSLSFLTVLAEWLVLNTHNNPNQSLFSQCIPTATC